MGLLAVLLAMLLLGKLLGDLTARLGFSALIGQMLAGIVLGPMCLNALVAFPAIVPDLDLLAGLAIIFIMFVMGLSIDFEKVMGESLYSAVLISLLGGSITFASTAAITALLGYSFDQALLVGVAFISTSTAIGYLVLTGFGDRHSNVFKIIMAVGTSDDIYAILALALFLAYMESGIDLKSAFSLFLLVLGFIIVVLKFGRTITDRLIDYSRRSRDDQSIISISLIILFFISFLSQSIGVASVTGAFLAGTILARSSLSYKVITPRIEAVSEGLFVPLFFVYTGMRIDIFAVLASDQIDLYFASVPLGVVLFFGLLMAVMASKYFGTYLAGLLIGGYKELEMHKMSLAMMPMGEYTLVIGQLGLAMSLIDTRLYSVLAVVVLITSIIVPVMMRTAYEG
ncbi:MAG TPA: cation:proton antiporter [Methanocella sp.]|nr:cation:proton antiporter [Methanocella sp.]